MLFPPSLQSILINRSIENYDSFLTPISAENILGYFSYACRFLYSTELDVFYTTTTVYDSNIIKSFLAPKDRDKTINQVKDETDFSLFSTKTKFCLYLIPVKDIIVDTFKNICLKFYKGVSKTEYIKYIHENTTFKDFITNPPIDFHGYQVMHLKRRLLTSKYEYILCPDSIKETWSHFFSIPLQESSPPKVEDVTNAWNFPISEIYKIQNDVNISTKSFFTDTEIRNVVSLQFKEDELIYDYLRKT